jgi:predicted permease
MSWLSRIRNAFRGDRLTREIDDEIESHIAEAIERGRDPAEARLAVRLDALRADIVFGWRQLWKYKVTSAAAILSLALAMGACLAVFRLLDALVLRPLPVSNPGRLFLLSYPRMNAAGQIETATPFDYPQFRKLRAAVSGDAELIAISSPGLSELTFGTDDQMERLRVQFVSGWMFRSFGLQPALGRLLAATDDATPGANAVAVLSWNAWTRRFGRDPNIVGRRFRFRDASYEIVGVSAQGFVGTEPGWATDLFVPTMMNAKLIDQPNLVWFNVFAHLAPGASPEIVRQKLKAAEHADRLERVKRQHLPRERYLPYVASELFLEPSASGYSGLQRQYGRPLAILACMVLVVLMIACVNVANLMTGRAQARAHEMALRVSIGAGRARLIQLVLVESALIGSFACGLGAIFARWAASFLVSQISPPAAPPITIALAYDWRVSALSIAIMLFATLSFGGIPALRASGIRPATVLRGSTTQRHRRSMNLLVGAQVAFCALVLFIAGLFAASFHRLTTHPLGFDADGLVNLNIVTRPDVPLADWEAVRRELQGVPGVAATAIATWPLLYGPVWSEAIVIAGKPVISEEANFLAVSPEWLRTVRIPLIGGRELRGDDPSPGAVLVNREFVRQYFDGQDPVGRSFRTRIMGKTVLCAIVGVVGDAHYSEIRQLVRSTVYLPFSSPQLVSPGAATFVVRTVASDPLPLVNTLRQRASQSRAFRVTDVLTQSDLIGQLTIRERLLALLSLFFAAVAVALSAVGLYGVLSYSVLQSRREIGIRIALGASGGVVAWSVLSSVAAMLVPGALVGLAAGIACRRYFAALLFETESHDPRIIGLTLAVTIAIALAAALPAVNRALRLDPSTTLRSE